MATTFERGGGGYGDIGDPSPGSVLARKIPPRVAAHASTIRLAVVAESAIRGRGRRLRRPDAIIGISRSVRLTSKGKRAKVNSNQTGTQLAFTGDRRKASIWPSDAFKVVVA